MLTRTLPLWNSGIVLTDTRLNNWGIEYVIAIFAQWLTNKAEPNKSGPRIQASKLGCLPLSAPLASVRESSLQRGYAWQLCDPGNALEWAERVKVGKRRMGATPATRNAMPIGVRAIALAPYESEDGL